MRRGFDTATAFSSSRGFRIASSTNSCGWATAFSGPEVRAWAAIKPS